MHHTYSFRLIKIQTALHIRLQIRFFDESHEEFLLVEKTFKECHHLDAYTII